MCVQLCDYRLYSDVCTDRGFTIEGWFFGVVWLTGVRFLLLKLSYLLVAFVVCQRFDRGFSDSFVVVRYDPCVIRGGARRSLMPFSCSLDLPTFSKLQSPW